MVPILVILLLIVINGLFVMAEMAVVSARKPRLQQMANEGSSGAQIAVALATNPMVWRLLLSLLTSIMQYLAFHLA